MADVAVGLASILCGCQANVFFLELIITGSPHTYFALTCAQYVLVAVCTLPLLLRLKAPHEQLEGASAMWPFQWRRSRIARRQKLLLAVVAWGTSVSNNIVFDFHVSVPLHSSFRSSSLLLNMLAAYLLFKKRFTRLQVAAAFTICLALVTLALEKSQKASASAGPAADDGVSTWNWACGAAIMMGTTAGATVLGVYQEYMYRCARASEAADGRPPQDDDAAPMWAEALCSSHLFAIPLFLLQPQRLWAEFTVMEAAGNQLHVVLNCLTQVICICGVYVMNNKTSSFTLSLTLTLRKLSTFVLSVMYFGHYRTLSMVEWVAMVAAVTTGSVYPFLPNAPGAAQHHRATAEPATPAAKSKKKA